MKLAAPVAAPKLTGPDAAVRRADPDKSVISVSRDRPNHAFGVDPTRRERYSLRQARYDAAAEDIDSWARERHAGATRFPCSMSAARRRTPTAPPRTSASLREYPTIGSDIPSDEIYKRNLDHEVVLSDLMAGQKEIPSESYDVVVCEQVLEHLAQIDLAIQSLERILKPWADASWSACRSSCRPSPFSVAAMLR